MPCWTPRLKNAFARAGVNVIAAAFLPG
jgi:hypothetical protein